MNNNYKIYVLILITIFTTSCNYFDKSFLYEDKEIPLKLKDFILIKNTDKDKKYNNKLSLEKAIEIGLKKNITLKIANMNTETAKKDKLIALSYFLPSLQSKYNYTILKKAPGITINTPSPTTFAISEKKYNEIEFELRMLIWDFGKTIENYRRTQILYEIKELEYLKEKYNLVYEIIKTYLSILNLYAQKRIIEKSIKQGESHLRIANLLYCQGIVNKTDVLKAKLHIENLEQNLVEINKALKLSYSQLNRLIGNNIFQSLKVIKPKKISPYYQDISLKQAIKEAIKNRPDIKITLKGIKLAKIGYNIKVAEYFPIIYFGARYNWSDDEYKKYIDSKDSLHQDNWAFLIGIKWDIFNGGRKLAQERKAKIILNKTIEKAKDIYNLIALEIEECILTLEENKKKIKVAKASIKHAKENLRLINAKYKVSRATSTDVIDAETLFMKAQVDYYSSIYTYWISLARLYKAIGTDINFQKKIFNKILSIN